MSLWRLIAGLFLGVCLVIAVWASGLVLPPESLARRVAAFSAVYPGPVGEAEVDRIDCPPMPRVRFYLVCTADCTQVRRLMAVRGLAATLLANLNRTPPEDLKVTRGRINAVIAGERLRLDRDGAREMIGCYMRIEGLDPARVLSEGGLQDVNEARSAGAAAVRRLADSLEDTDTLARIEIEDAPDGFRAGFLYWETARAGDPVLRISLEMSGDGVLRAMRATQVVAPKEPPAGESGTPEPGEPPAP